MLVWAAEPGPWGRGSLNKEAPEPSPSPGASCAATAGSKQSGPLALCFVPGCKAGPRVAQSRSHLRLGHPQDTLAAWPPGRHLSQSQEPEDLRKNTGTLAGLAAGSSPQLSRTRIAQQSPGLGSPGSPGRMKSPPEPNACSSLNWNRAWVFSRSLHSEHLCVCCLFIHPVNLTAQSPVDPAQFKALEILGSKK